MSLERKVRQVSEGGVLPPLTRLKGLSPEVQAGVMGILRDHTYEQAPPFVEALVGFAVSEDTLERFYAWQSTRRVMGCAAESMSEVIEFLKEHYTNWTEEKMREAASAFFMAKTIEKQDARGFACVAQLGLASNRDKIEAEKVEFEKVKLERRSELTAKRLELDQAKFKWAKTKQIDIAMDALNDEFRGNPKALNLFWQAREALGGRETQGEHPSGGERVEGRGENEGAELEGPEILNSKSECLNKSEDRNPKSERSPKAEDRIDSNAESEKARPHLTPALSPPTAGAERENVRQTFDDTKSQGASTVGAVYPGTEQQSNGTRVGGEAEREKLCALLRGFAAMKKAETGTGSGTLPSLAGGTPGATLSEAEGQGENGEHSNAECGTRSAELKTAEHRTPNAERSTSNLGNGPKGRKRAVYRQCKCFCAGCNSKSGVTLEEAGSLLEAAPSHIDRYGCLCFCERCHEAEKEVWRKTFST